MIDVGAWLVSIFGDSSGALLLIVFLIFFVDAMFFPTLPELFFIATFAYDPTLQWGAELLSVAIIAEIVGALALYYIVEHVHVPRKIEVIVEKYVNFLFIRDERMIFMNRFAPLIPFTGAFMSIIKSWRLSHCIFYIFLGCLVKYGLIALLSSYFYTFFSTSMAQTVSFAMVFTIMGISLIMTYVRKKKTDKELGESSQ